MAHSSKDEKIKIRNAMRIKRSLDKEMIDHNLGDSSPETEDIDFKNIIHPLSFYIHDREQMIEEMFSIIKGEKLRKMLPPLLKNYSLEELKADCLVHLLGMSKKRICAILEGRELNSSSDSESESSNSSNESDEFTNSPKNKSDVKLNIDEDDLLDISVSKNDVEALIKDKSKISNQPLKKLKKKIKTEKNDPVCSIIISDDDTIDENSVKKQKKMSHNHVSSTLDKIAGNKQKGKRLEKNEKSKSNSTNCTTESNYNSREINVNQEDKNDKGKTLLDILELEMRARAIRALLKNTPNPEEEEPASMCNVKIESENEMKTDLAVIDSVVDSVLQMSDERSNLSKTNENVLESVNDIEIIDVTDVDFCVTIDDDDDISIDPNNRTIDLEVGDKENDKISDEAMIENGVPSQKNSSIISPPVENSSEKSVDPSVNSKDHSTWSERWAENKNVKEIVKNSKICANIRKRMRFARMLKQKQSKEKLNDEVDFGNVDESSVAHYDMIKAYNLKNQAIAGDQKSDNKSIDLEEPTSSVMSKSNDADTTNISSEDPVLENDPKTLILDVSDDDVTSIFNQDPQS